MSKDIRKNIGEARLVYTGRHDEGEMSKDKLSTFNLRHQEVLGYYDLELAVGSVFVISDQVNRRSNLGVFRSKQLRQAVVLAAALPAAAVVLHGFGSLQKVPEDLRNKELENKLKRMNDRTAAQVMGEVLQITTETLDVGEEVIIESAITEGVRAKPGVEPGGNPTIAVGTLYGKEEHCRLYGHGLGPEVVRLSMGSDVIDGTGKSIKGQHSSLTALFITESDIKRHLPDIYVERWIAGVPFPRFNPRDSSLQEEAEIIRNACGFQSFDQMTAFFLNRPRHVPAMDQLNALGVATPFDQDGDLFPALVLGLPGLSFPDGRGLTSMIGEIGGSAEWAVGVLPLIWRGGGALGMLTSQSSLTRKDLTPQELWNERFHYTEEELMLIQDARFEQKPFFSIEDILERPFAGGISAFSAISDNYYFPELKGVAVDRDQGIITTNTLIINSLGVIEHWRLAFKCVHGLENTTNKMKSPKAELREQERGEIESKVQAMADNLIMRDRLRQFFINEYYPAIIHTGGRMVILQKTVETLISRGALHDYDRDIVRAVVKAAPEWFTEA